MVGFEDYHGSRQQEHLAKHTSKIICDDHICDPSWNNFAQNLLSQRLKTQLELFASRREPLSEFSLIARFGVFYVVDASLTLGDLHQRVNIGELSNLIVKNRMYRKGKRPQYERRETNEESNLGFAKVKLPKSDHAEDSNKCRKLTTLNRNKNGLSVGYLGTLETDRPTDLKLQLRNILKKRGYHPMQHSVLKSDSQYFWKNSIWK